ncbi:JmjC domain-containing protein [Streptomyces sp. NPDC101234]|uniref:JmjC domain-containing protein n=1 Tax=Streptomyces sp. NPDC101234 TaxID=3366138 RepID=UPI00380E0378
MDLATLVAPMSIEDFLTDTWGQRTAVFPGPFNRFVELLDWRKLSSLLSEHRHVHPRFRLSREGSVIPREAYMRQASQTGPSEIIEPVQLYRQLQDGAMLVLDSVDDMVPNVRELALSLESVFRETVVVNAYAGWSEIEGFDLHWDDHDVIVLQVFGQKAWGFYGSSRDWPMRKDVEPNTEPPCGPEDTLLVNAGDVLYVPRGQWHRVHATKTPSLHLTIGVTRRTGYDFLSWLAEDLLDSPVLRQDIPRHADKEERSRYFAGVRDEVLRRLTADSLERFLYVSDATATSRAHINLDLVRPDPYHVTAESLLEWLAPRAVPRTVEGRTTLGALGRVWTFAEPASVILRVLMSRPTLTLQQLCSAVGSLAKEDQIRAFVLELHVAGLLSVGTPAP